MINCLLEIIYEKFYSVFNVIYRVNWRERGFFMGIEVVGCVCV